MEGIEPSRRSTSTTTLAADRLAPMVHVARTRAVVALAVLALTGAVAGCGDQRRAAGGKCGLAEEGQLVACDGAAALLCRNLRLHAVPCRGARGCSGAGSPHCDESLALEGDACTTPDAAETACAADHTKTLVCRDGRFVAGRLCRGPKGCVEGGGEPSCDQTLGQAGEVCSEHGAVLSCSSDRKALLECKDDPTAVPSGLHAVWRGPKGRFAVKSECPTTKGCHVGHLTGSDIPVAVCDYRGIEAGARCGRGDENRTICSPDGAAILKCDPTSLAFGVELTCPKGQRCAPYQGKTDQVNPVVGCAPSDPAR
jgi:hypothetical protein